MSSKIGWEFPPTNGGQEDGYNHSGITHFDGAPLSSLARETIQNSLDAPGPRGGSVHVSFELVELATESLGGEELLTAVAACDREEFDSTKTEEALQTARETLKQDSVSCLRISDQNTTGLEGDRWRTLVKMQGASHKPDTEGAGGSHGIGNTHHSRYQSCVRCFIGLATRTTEARESDFKGNQCSCHIKVSTVKLKAPDFMESRISVSS